MSFGFSVGDFIAAGVLIKNIVSALQTSSTSEHQELLLELTGLQRALDEIEHLQADPQQLTEVNAVKVAALTCQYRLTDFAGKLRKYESLSRVRKASSAEKAKLWRLKLQWGFSMEAEVQSLRAYLIAHVGYLNMRLTTLNLTSSWHVSQEIAQQRTTLEKHIVDSQEAALNVASELAAQKYLMQESSSWAQRLAGLISCCLLPQVAMLVDLVGKIWVMDKQIIDILMRQHSTTTGPDLHHTWFQQPIKFEDALGRVLPVPSEYNLGKINAIILDQFRVGPGHDKVSCGEYELFNSIDARQPLSDPELEMLIPGMSITMAFVIGLYEQQPVKKCPRPSCQTREFSTPATGGQRCDTCSVWFGISRTKLPRPFRLPATEDVFRQIRAERKWFKNVRLFPSEPPSLPLRADESGQLEKCARPEGVFQVQTTKDGILEDRATHSSQYRAFRSLPYSSSRINVSYEIAIRAIEAIAEICELTVDELREICGSDADFTGSLRLDSLLRLEVIDTITRLGVEVPGSAAGSYLAQEVFGSFLKSLVLKCIDVVDQVGS